MNLGDKVKDTVTGFTGIAVAKLERFKGTTTFAVQSTVLVEGRIIEDWFEEGRLEAVPAKMKKRAA